MKYILYLDIIQGKTTHIFFNPVRNENNENRKQNVRGLYQKNVEKESYSVNRKHRKMKRVPQKVLVICSMIMCWYLILYENWVGYLKSHLISKLTWGAMSKTGSKNAEGYVLKKKNYW